MQESKGWDSDHSQSTKDSSEDEEEEEEEGAGSKAEADTGRKSKRIKAKQQVAATTSLLTSAASKLSAITDNGTNEDSNDSFELDISSRGRLRKRRVIPNNTEDTGLRKRKLVDFVTGNTTPSSGTDVTPPSSGLSSSATPPISTLASTVSHPTVIQKQQGKPWPSHILSMLTSGGLGTSSSAIRAQLGGQLVTTKAGSSSNLQQQLLAGQVFRLVTPGSDGSIRALHVAGNVTGGRSLHAAPGSVIISPQNLASIRFVSSTGVVTLPRERILSAGSSSTSSTSISSSPAQASHPVIQQLLLNKSAKGLASPSKVTFVPNVTANGGISNQSLQQQPQQSGLSGINIPKMSMVAPPSATSTLTLHHPGAMSNRPSLIKPPVVMVTPQNASKLSGTGGLSAASAAPVVVSQVSSTMSGGKQVLDLGSLSVTQIQQLMRNQAIQINMGGTSSGPTTLLLTTGLQQLGTAVSTGTSAVGSSTMASSTIPANLSGVRLPQQHQQTIRPAVVATGASSLLAMINNKGQKLMTLPASSNTVLSTQHGVASQLVDGQLVIKGGSTAAVTTSLVSTNSALKSVLSNRSTLPQSVLTGKILSSSIQNRLAAGSGTTIIAAKSNNTSSQPARITLPVPQIISSLSASAPVAATTLVSSTLTSNAKGTSVNSCPGGKDNPQQKSRTIITVPLVHLSSPGKKYASNVTVKALLENRAPKKTDDDTLKNIPLSSESTVSLNSSNILASKASETSSGSQSKENEIPAPKESVSILSSHCSSQAVLTSLSMPLSVSTGGLECATSEVIVPTVHIKVPSPNTLPSVLHNKNGTTIVQSTKVPIAMASEARAPETASPSSGSSLVAGPGNMLQSANPSSKAINILPVSSASQSVTSTALTVSGASLHQNQQQGVKNVMLKVTPQSGGSGQFVQGFMTSRGLVIPQSALVQQQQQQQGKSVIVANVAQNGSTASIGQVGGQQAQQVQSIASLPVQHTGLSGQPAGTLLARPQIPNLNQSQQPLQVLGAAPNSSSAVPFSSQIQKGTVLSSGGLKFMLVNPVGQTAPAFAAGQQNSSLASNLGPHQVLAAAAQQPQTSTPAAELVKQIAANSIQVQSSSQAGHLTPSVNSGLSPRVVQKSNVVLRAPTGIVRMSASGVVSTTTSPRASGSAVPQAGLGTGGILSGQTVISSNVSPSNISPQLAAQILALQQQQQQQQPQQGIVMAGGKPAAVGQQPQQQNQPGVPSVVTLQLQQLGQLFSSLTQLQPGGVQQQQQQQQQPVTPSLAGGQQPGQVVQLSLNPGQALMPGGSHAQTPQLVKVAGGQVSPQIQLTNGQLQSGQGAGLVLQQPQATQLSSQNLLLQHKPVVSASIGLQQQPNALPPLLNPQQQQQAGILKLPQQAATITMKPQLSVASSLSSSSQALQVLQHQHGETNTSSTPVSLSPSQGFVVSPASAAALPASQPQQVQFVLNQSSLASLPVASGIATGVSALTGLNKLPGGGNIRRVIRADSSLLHTSLTSTPSNIASPAVVLGGSNPTLNSAQLSGNKQGVPQMLLPTSAAGSGQILISPMKLGASPQANIISPLKLLGGLQVASSAATSGAQGTQILMNSNQLPGTILGKPSVIYAGQPAQVQGSVDKSDASKMTQILLSQSNGNLLQMNKDVNVSATPVLNSQQQLLIKSAGQVLQTPAAGAQIKQLPANVTGLSNVAGAKTTYLYKVGEQYFSPTGPLAVSGSQLGPTTSLSGIPSSQAILPPPLNAPKPDVQLLVPPACIEASEKMLLQSSRNVNAPSGSGKLHQPPTASNESSSSNSGTMNGANFSFSLSGPISLDKSQLSPFTSNPSQTTNGQATHAQSKVDGVTSKMQLKQQSGIPTNGGDAASVSGVTQLQQVISTAATGDEEEAAMNLLTLANQAV